MENSIIFIFQIIVLIVSVMIHEVAHGYIADRLGDPTARRAGRLTFNPISHIDPFGSVILPILLSIPSFFGGSGIIFGYAKPVPYNPNNLKDPIRGGALIAAAGPLSNILIAGLLGVVIRIFIVLGINMPAFITLMSIVVTLNLVLALFNLVPIPPLDGSKVLNFFLPRRVQFQWERFSYNAGLWIQRNWIIFLILFIFLFKDIIKLIFIVISPIIKFLFSLFTGLPLEF